MQELIANLKDAARYLLQNGQTKQGVAVQACVTMLEDDSEDGETAEPLDEGRLFALLMGCTEHPPARLPPGYVAFARAVEQAHGISPCGVPASAELSIPVVCEHCDEMGNCTGAVDCAARNAGVRVPDGGQAE